tara:strand:- start:22390 stop:22665 length:276 start_codon:yes stop_codon:yes gene_type:complete
MSKKSIYKNLLKNLPISEIMELIEILKNQGLDESEIIEQVSVLLDQMIDFEKIIKRNPEVGAAIESIDDKLIATIIKISISIAKARKLFGK